MLAAAEVLGVAADALDAAERAELVRVRDARIELRHPLLRAARLPGRARLPAP